MGLRGTRLHANNDVPENKVKRKIDNTKHTELCTLAAKWLYKGGRTDKIHCSSVAVEPFSMNVLEQPDVFGWNYWTTAIIEIKTTRSDFIKDFKKPFRILPDQGVGEHRFFCCPKGLIKIEEIPDSWGLLYENNGKIEMIRNAQQQKSDSKKEFHILASISRKFGFNPRIYYCKNTDKKCSG